MVVSVHKARQDDLPGQIQNDVGFRRQLAGRADVLHESVPHEDPAAGNLPTLIVHGDEEFGVPRK